MLARQKSTLGHYLGGGFNYYRDSVELNGKKEMTMQLIGEESEESEEGQYIGRTFEPHKFASRELAEEYQDSFDEYVELRVRGEPRDVAAIQAFNMIRHGVKLDNADLIGMACDANQYVMERFKTVLASKDIKRDLWTQNDAANAYLRMIRDPRVRDSTRLNAINSLTLLCKYVDFDEMTARRVDKTISEFKRQHAAWMEAGSPTQGPSQASH